MSEIKKHTSEAILTDMSYSPPYNLGDLPLYLGEAHLSDFNELKTSAHWNDDLEIVYISENHMSIIVNGENFIIEEGEIAIINSGCVHYFESIDGKDCKFYVALANEMVFSAAEPIKEKYINPMYHAYHPNIDIVRKDSEYIEEIYTVLKAMGRLLDVKDAAFDIRLVARLHEFVGLLWCALRESFFLPVPVESAETEAFRKMIVFIQKNYSKKLLVSDMAEVGGISRKQCFTLFSKYLNKTPGDFLIDYRLEAGRSMLKNSRTSIADIAAACGFSHQSHFTNHFRARYGMTPNAYRRITKGKN